MPLHENPGALLHWLSRQHWRASRAGSYGFQRVFEAYLSGHWFSFDARHNRPRIGRILMATGCDAIDVALSTSFGSSRLAGFEVVTEEVPAEHLLATPMTAQGHVVKWT